jgi:hypothetical protein
VEPPYCRVDELLPPPKEFVSEPPLHRTIDRSFGGFSTLSPELPLVQLGSRGNHRLTGVPSAFTAEKTPTVSEALSTPVPRFLRM